MKNLNYQDMVYIDYKKYISIYLFVVLIISLLIISFKFTVYSTKSYNALFEKDNLTIILPYDDVENLKNSEYLMINEDKYDFEIISFSEVYSVGEYYYQTATFTVDEDFLENEIVEIKVFYNKDKMINKIIDLIF